MAQKTLTQDKKYPFVKFENETDAGLAASCYFSELIAVINQIIRCTRSRNSLQHASLLMCRAPLQREEGRINQHPSCNQDGGASCRTADARPQMNYSFYVLLKPKTQNKNTHCCAVNKTFKVGRPLEPDSSVLFMPDR